MLENYFPVLLFICVGIAMGVVPVILGKLVGSQPARQQKTVAIRVWLRGF